MCIRDRFVGELLVILASIKVNFWVAFLSATTLVIGAAYTLWMIKRVIYGQVTNNKINAIQDVNTFEFIPLVILAIMVLFIGIYPAPLMELMFSTLNNLSQIVIDGVGL